MNERIVALDRNGTLRLIAVNGDGPREVGHLEVGHLPDADAAMIAAAFADLRALATRPSAPRVADPVVDVARVVHDVAQSELAALSKARKPTKRTGTRAPAARGQHRALIVTYLREHGSERCAVMARAVDITVKAASNALSSMQRKGEAHNVGGVWSLTDMGDAATSEPAPRRASLASVSGTEAAAARVLEVLARHPEGLGGLALVTMAGVSKASYRRALPLLRQRGRIRREGETNGTTWHYVAPAGVMTLELDAEGEGEGSGSPERVREHGLERYL